MPAHATRNPQHATRKLVPLLLKWFSAQARDLPWRRTRDPYAIWVSEIMLQQTQVKTVIPYWERWMRELPTIQAAAKASPAKLHKLWEGLGYYTRVRNLQKAAQQIVTQHDGIFPEDSDAVLALPGIGRYTAGAICSIAFNQPTPILDGNVMRVLTRIFGIATDPREKETNARLWALAEELVVHAKGAETAMEKSAPRPSRPLREVNSSSHLNQSLMELGALVCTPRSPTCVACPVEKLCLARRQDLQDLLPNLGQRAATTQRRFVAFVVERNGKFLVRQRPAGVVNAHLWEFPNVERPGAPSSRRRVSKSWTAQPTVETIALPGLRLRGDQPLLTVKHSITRYRITLEVWHAELGPQNSLRLKMPGRWLTLPQLHQLAFTSAHKKILVRLATAC